MRHSSIILIFLASVALVLSEVNDHNVNTYEEERETLDILLSSDDGEYDPSISPGKRNVAPVEVAASMYILDITSVNDFKNEFSTQFYFRQRWNDPRLAFDHFYTKLPHLRVQDVEKVWRPDSFFVQERVGKLHTIMMPNTFMHIYRNGDVLYSVRLSMTFGCNMDLRYYPLDTQKCSFSIESYGSKANEIKYKWGYDDVSVGATNDTSALDFSLISIKLSSSALEFTSGNYSRLELDLMLKRKVGFFMNKLYVPFVILVITSWLSFWIKAKFASLRLTLILTILFIMFWLESDVSRHTPPVSYTKAIDVWTGVCLSFVFASLLQFILVSQLGRNEKHRRKHNQSAVDPEALLVREEGNNSKFVKNSNLDNIQVNAVSRLIAGNLSEGKKTPKKIDNIARIFYPLSFLIFNLVYWPVYCSGN